MKLTFNRIIGLTLFLGLFSQAENKPKMSVNPMMYLDAVLFILNQLLESEGSGHSVLHADGRTVLLTGNPLRHALHHALGFLVE